MRPPRAGEQEFVTEPARDRPAPLPQVDPPGPDAGNLAVARAVERPREVAHLPAEAVAGLLPAGNAAVGDYLVARRWAAGRPEIPGSELADRIRGRLGRGEPLPADVRAETQAGLGSPLGDVRVHRDPQAASLAGDLGARAFTTGQDVFFGAGEYNPAASSGYELLAHELTHTVKQRGNPVAGRPVAPGLVVSQPNDHDELAAAHASHRATLMRGATDVPAGDAGVRAPAAGGDLSVLRAGKDDAGAVNARETYRAWLTHWASRQAAAKSRLDQVQDQLRAANVIDYAEKKQNFDQGLRNALGSGYEAAANEWDLCSVELSETDEILKWLEAQEVLGRPVTLEAVNKQALAIAESRQRGELWLALLSLGLGALSARAPTSTPRGRTAAEESTGGGIGAGVAHEQARRQAVDAVTERVGLKGEDQAKALGTAYDVASEYSAPFVVDLARRMLADLKADVAGNADAVIVFVGRDGHSLAVATQVLDPAFFQAHCREVVLSRAVVESAVLDLERNAGRAFPQIADFRGAAGKVDPADIAGARQALTAYLQENGVPVGKDGSAVTLVDTSFKGTVQELLAAIYPETRFRGRYAFFGASPKDPHPGSKTGYEVHLEVSESSGGRPVPHLPDNPAHTFANQDAIGVVEETLHGPMSSPKGFGPEGRPVQRPQREEGDLKGLNPTRVGPEYAGPEIREGVKDVNLLAVVDEAKRIAAIRDAGGNWEAELVRGSEKFRDQVRKWVTRSPDVDPRFSRLMDSFVRRTDKGAVNDLADAIARARLSDGQAAEIWRAYDQLTTVEQRQQFATRKAKELGQPQK